ncbi:hypothetical protein D3C78_947590 [compost metagenome]
MDITFFMGATHLDDGGAGISVVADGADHAGAVDLRRQRWRNADQAHGLAGFGKRFGQGQYIWVNGAASAFNGKVGEVLRRTKPSWNDQRIEIVGVRFMQVLDVSAGDTCRLHQHVARFGHLFARQVVDDMPLRNVRRKALYLGAALIEAQQCNYAFVDFGAVIDATAGKNHCNFFLGHAHYSRVEALNVL